MRSKWFYLKEEAIKLRRQGISTRKIERRLGIPRSTLSGWFRTVVLTKFQQAKLHRDWCSALVNARKGAVKWHNEQKRLRLQEAENKADLILSKINTGKAEILELAFAMLYIGEGFKTNSTGLGNSDPLIIRFFISALEILYGFDVKKFRYELHLRADQDPDLMKKYWAEQLCVPVSSFKYAVLDKRTIGKPTYPSYKGVCIVHCANIAIQRKSVYLSRKFCEKVINNLRA